MADEGNMVRLETSRPSAGCLVMGSLFAFGNESAT